jgi:ubiquinone/menaquinone biosynthesis C-methylase UbiE
MLFNFFRRLVENSFRAEKGVILKELAPHPGQKILDLGCGTGEFSTLFSPDDYLGVDLSARYIAYARRVYRHDFQVGDIRALNLPDHTFDAVLVVGVLHHLPDEDTARVLREIQRVLKPTGQALVLEDIPTVSNYNLLGKLIHYLENGHNIRRAEQYRALFEKHLSIERTYPIQSGLCDYQVFVMTPGARQRRGEAFAPAT